MQDSSDADFAAPTPEELAPFFPAYQIHSFIAQGGMGAVYSATQTSLDRPVAIKILPRVFSNDPKFQANFETEAKAMARLSHSNLIAVFDFGEADGMLFIVMELVEGKSLHESCRGQPIEQKEAGRIVSEICKGLAHAHKGGIIHRDIKPGNILLTPDAEPKIGDFGLAHPLGENELEEGENIWGTPGYTAPEVIHNPSGVDHRADIFSVGVLLFELLTGRIPESPPNLPSSLSKCDRGFDQIFQRATHPDPTQRYPSADAMAKDVDALLQRLQNPKAASAQGTAKGKRGFPPKKKATTVKRPVAARGLPASPPSITPVPAKKPKPPILIPVVVMVFIVGLIAFLMSGEKPKPAPAAENPGTTSIASGPQVPAETGDETKPSEGVADSPDGDETDPEAPSPEDTPETEPSNDPDPDLNRPASLADLAETLGRGNFAVLPEEAIRIGNFVFLLVDEPTTWHGALEQAETAGAQLAVLDSPKAVAWASENLKSESPLWLGLSDSGTEGNWYWASGLPLNPQLWAPGQGAEGEKINCGALLPGTPVLDDLEENLELPFVLQWVEGRPAPGTLREQMNRVGQNFRTKTPPVFPTGSINVGGSRFLLVPGKVSWEVANAAAVSSGGHLAVPSFEEEAEWIASGLARWLANDRKAWVGGRFTGGTWKYTTGELFYFVDWGEGEPGEPTLTEKTFLEVRPDSDGTVRFGGGSGQEGDADFYLVEWSAPSRRNLPDPGGNRTAEEWLTSFRTTFLQSQDDSMDSIREEVRDNAESWIRDLKRDTRDIRSFNTFAARFVDSMEEEVERTGRVPEGLAREISRFVGDSHEEALAEQRSIEEGSEEALEKSRTAYRGGLKNEIVRRTRIGDKEGNSYLKADWEQVGEDSYFREILMGENPQPTLLDSEAHDFKEALPPPPGPVFDPTID